MTANEKKKPSEFLCRLKYRNTLPEIPVAPKLLKYAFDNDRFVHYCTTTLEKNSVADIMPDIVRAVPIDLVDIRQWNLDEAATLAPEDEELLRGVDKIQGPRSAGQGRFHRPEVSWLRRTDYISADFFRKQERLSEKKKERRASSISAAASDLTASVITSFIQDDPLKHPTNENLTAVEVIPMFPDFDFWKFQFAQATFDSDGTKRADNSDGGILKALAAISEETKEKVPFFYHYAQQDDDPQVFTFSRDYSNVSIPPDPKQFFLSFRSGKAFYCPLPKKCKLKKRRSKFVDESRVTKIIRIPRDFDSEEIAIADERLEELNQPK